MLFRAEKTAARHRPVHLLPVRLSTARISCFWILRCLIARTTVAGVRSKARYISELSDFYESGGAESSNQTLRGFESPFDSKWYAACTSGATVVAYARLGEHPRKHLLECLDPGGSRSLWRFGIQKVMNMRGVCALIDTLNEFVRRSEVRRSAVGRRTMGPFLGGARTRA